MATFSGNLEIIKQKLAQKLSELPPVLGEEAVNFFHSNFDKQAWQGNPEQAWAKRKNPTKWGKKEDDGRAILIQSGAGKRSVKVGKIEKYKVFIEAGGEVAPYMKVHNEGFQGVVNQEVRPFTKKKLSKKGKEINVKGHNRTIYQNIPKRQFIGNEAQAPKLKERLQETIKEELKKVFN